MPNLGVPELLILLLIVLLIFGSTRLPQLGRGIGEGIRNLRLGLRGGQDGQPSDDEDGQPSDKPDSSAP